MSESYPPSKWEYGSFYTRAYQNATHVLTYNSLSLVYGDGSCRQPSAEEGLKGREFALLSSPDENSANFEDQLQPGLTVCIMVHPENELDIPGQNETLVTLQFCQTLIGAEKEAGKEELRGGFEYIVEYRLKLIGGLYRVERSRYLFDGVEDSHFELEGLSFVDIEEIEELNDALNSTISVE